jgi:FHS family L-fucose permease-like MFS transporter
MGAVSDAFGHPKYGFILATLFAALLFAGMLFNWIYNPAKERLVELDSSEYSAAGS